MSKPEQEEENLTTLMLHHYHHHHDTTAAALMMDLDDAPWPLDQIFSSSSSSSSPFLLPFHESTSYEQVVQEPSSPLWTFTDIDDENLAGAGDANTNTLSAAGLRISECSHQFTYPLNSDQGNEGPKVNENRRILRQPLIRPTFIESDRTCVIKERMTQALRYFKESTDQHVLAQVWAPVKKGDKYVLTTLGQPFVLDPHSTGLNQYRMVSSRYVFSVDGDSGDGELGLPGRVYKQKLPEWTPNVQYYSRKEYSRLVHALHYNVRGTLALPVFEPSGQSCVGVLEIILTSQIINYASEVDKVCKALEAVNLKSSEILEHPQTQISNRGRYDALAEIMGILTVICETHNLPLAQTWVPCKHHSILANGGGPKKSCSSFDGSCAGQVCMSTSDVAFYVNDPDIREFRGACAEHHLQSGQGVAGRAFSSHSSCFCSNIKEFSKTEYPLVHYARLFDLASCFAICLQSTHTGNDDYILEFFLPRNITEARDQQTLLDKILLTMSLHFKSFKIASQREFDDEKSTEIIEVSQFAKSSPEPNVVATSEIPNIASYPEKKRAKNTTEKKRGKPESSISLAVLKQYFSGSLKDAAKSLGVCPTTMKRICRQHGISRWPSRKINKANRSLTKLKLVMESVQCSEGAFGLSCPAENQFSQPISPPLGEKVVASPTSCDTPGSRNSSPDDHDPGQNGLQRQFSGKYKTRSCSPVKSVGSPTSHVSCKHSSPPVNENEITTDHSIRTRDSMEVANRQSNLSEQSLRPPNLSAQQITTVTVKATYRDNIIRFKIPLSSSITEWREEIAKRLKLEVGTFELKYLDDDREWVHLACNADLQECMDISKSMGSNVIRLSILNIIGNFGSSGESTIW